MFGKKKSPVLTATTCTMLEQLRLAIEVATGKRTCFVSMDLNTCRGKVRMGDKEEEVTVIYRRDDLLEFSFGADKDWLTAVFWNHNTYVKVGSLHNASVRLTVAGDFTMQWVGTSMSDRKEEPLFFSEAQYCAKVRGLTLDQLLASRPVNQ